MRVMITGAAMPFVAALLDQLLAFEVELVLAIGRESERPPIKAEDRLLYHDVDLTRPRQVHDLLWGLARDQRIDSVVHGVHHRSSRYHGRRIHAQNVEATRSLVVGCAEHPSYAFWSSTHTVRTVFWFTLYDSLFEENKVRKNKGQGFPRRIA